MNWVLYLQIMKSNDCDENAETVEYQENTGSMFNMSGYFNHVDECSALTEQVFLSVYLKWPRKLIK